MPAYSTRDLVILGGGGHALVTLDAARESGWAIRGFLDDNEHAPLKEFAPRLGALEMVDPLDADNAPLILGLGDLDRRRSIIESVHSRNWTTIIHPAAWASSLASIGEGVLIGAGAIVQGRAQVLDHAIINTGAIIEHDVTIGENSHIAPRVALGGDVSIGANTLIGIGASIRPQVRIGENCTIGAGAVVVADVPDGATVAGVPARPLWR